MIALRYLLLVCLVLPLPARADVLYDGIDDDLTTGLALSTFLSAATGSVAVWLKPTGAGDSVGTADCYEGQRILGDGVPGTTFSFSYFGLSRNTNLASADKLCVGLWSTDEKEGSATYTNNAWVHLAAVHAAGTLVFYKNGVQITSVAAGNIDDISRVLLIGFGTAMTSLSQSFEGTLAEVIFAPTALSAGVIANLASGVRRTAPVALSLSLPLDDCADGASGEGVSFKDRSGNARHGTGVDGANNTGLTCKASDRLSYPWGVE
jgi:hypothetical protein